MRALFGTTDALKSFPSGHTCSAGTVYCLLMLLDVFNVKSKGKRAVSWIAAITYTGMVAVSRIIVGAHFFSDVLMGGTIAFVSMIIFREIFICKGSNVKAMFGKE
jgi:membrane-associated phospholipid phosphatase